MLRKEWQYYASKARKIAKHIKTGAEENRDGTRWSKIIDVQDINATAALNKKFAKDGSRASVHTYWGGKQEIATTHTDGSKGLFQTNGECQSTNNPMDIEVAQYMNNSKNESKNMNKKLIRLTESDLHRIVKESVKRALMENIYNTHQYQIVAYLIDPNADWQREGLSSDDYEESKRDFGILSNLNCILNRQAINIFRKYQINSGAVEEHNSEEPFIMDIDGDGIYLLKRID